MQANSIPSSGNDISTDSVDSCTQIELSGKDNNSHYTMGANLGHIWKGGYFNNSFPPVYQYPFAEWIPNSICYADFCSRMKTFDKWPKQMRPSPIDLVRSGFFTKEVETMWSVFSVEFAFMTGKQRIMHLLNITNGLLHADFFQ